MKDHVLRPKDVKNVSSVSQSFQNIVINDQKHIFDLNKSQMESVKNTDKPLSLNKTLLDENTVLGYKKGWNSTIYITFQMLIEELWIWLRVYKCKTDIQQRINVFKPFFKIQNIFWWAWSKSSCRWIQYVLSKEIFQSEFKLVRFGPMTF